MKRRPRMLSREDRAIWDHVARQIRPMTGRDLRDGTEVETPRRAEATAQPARPDPATPAPIPPFRIGARAGQTAAPPDTMPPQHPVRMDRKAHARLKGGKLSPEARIDLHGMTLAEAHPALIGFILYNQAKGRRLVLVITGKGRGPDGGGPIPERRGILKRQVPHWLHQPPLAQAVLQVTQAHRRHGGDGAVYVYLRRPK